jgi:hypothetical protein
MPVVRITRFTTDDANAEEVLARRATLIGAVRSSFPGLTEARLGRRADGTWIDVWRWASAADADAVVAAGLPEAAAAFALVKDVESEELDVVDER